MVQTMKRPIQKKFNLSQEEAQVIEQKAKQLRLSQTDLIVIATQKLTINKMSN